MKTINYAVFFSIYLLIQQHVFSLSHEPFLFTPGSSSILVFLDLHRSYYDGSCADPDWNVFELAQSLHWKSNQENVTGIEIYDTCRYQRLVQDIIRQRLVPENCLKQPLPPVSGVISQSSKVINDVIRHSFDLVHVVIDNGAVVTEDRGQTDGKFYIELASKYNIEILAHILISLNWTYVTTLSDSHSQSQLEHDMFTGMADDINICIQTSQLATNLPMAGIFNPKTNGVVIFTNDMNNLKTMMQKLPKSSPVVIVTHDRRTSELSFVHEGIVLSYAFLYNEQFTEYMTTVLWNQTALDDLSIDYYVSNHNCSFKNQSVPELISCENIKGMEAYFRSVSSTRQMNAYQEAFTFIANIGNKMAEHNCTNFNTSCVPLIDIDAMSSYFKAGNNQTLVPRLPFSTSISLLTAGTVQKSDDYSTTDFTDFTSFVSNFTDGASFPSSTCTEWCPSCQQSTCSTHSNTMDFKGDYFYVPGDIIITGMLPLSQQWNKVSSSGNVCSGMRLDSNLDTLSEAFLYAVMSVHDRFSDLLQNVEIGALLLDTCSDSDRASQILLNFESCMYNFKTEGNNWKPSPAIVPAYIVVGNNEKFIGESKAVGKLALGIQYQGDLYRNERKIFDSSSFNFEILANFLHTMNLSYVGLVTSFAPDNVNINNLYETAKSKNICIAYNADILPENTDLLNAVRKSTAEVVIIYARSADVANFFRMLTTKSIIKTWILIETRENWLDTSAFPLPAGSVIFRPYGQQNSYFNEHMNNLLNNQQNNITTNNPWIDSYRQARSDDNIQIKPFTTDITTRMQASDVIRSVDISLEAIAQALKSVCGNETRGLCPEFVSKGGEEVLRALDQLWFINKSSELLYPSNPKHQHYVIKNLQQEGLVEVGSWSERGLTLESTKLRSYDSKFNQLPEFRKSYCFVTPCSCFNINTTANESETAKITRLDYEMGFKNSSAKFQKDLWVLIVVIISGTGSLLTLLLMIYIMCKVCSGALVRRYLALGILLLIAMILLFLSVLPFLFSPSESVCGMRYFAHGFSYAFCFGIILTKMMTLRNYKYIGLGGEISRINQMLTVFFITSVQVAVGVQWWVLRTPVVFTERVLEAGENDALRETTYYACDFVRKDFVAYHSYVIFLLVLCCFYSLSVRKETKNMKEARLLLICTWFCLVLWIGIIVTIMVLDRKYLEAICAIGILGNALSMVVFIYLPKLTAISRLKYEVSEQNAHKENGYKVDSDFHFERPYSLPGTLHSSITDKALTYPRSLATFDTSLSY